MSSEVERMAELPAASAADTPADAAAYAVAARVGRGLHSQLCPVWTGRAGVERCDCWVMPRCRADATVAVNAYLECRADRHPESYCHRCGGPNVSWYAPSPLWNAVMRGGSIDGPWQYDEIVCPLCFAKLAQDAGAVGGSWRFYSDRVLIEVETITPSGRVWNPDTWLWEQL